MNWDDLTVFRTTAEELSFTRAAGRLRLSVSAVSQRVRRLERAVGARLLDRTTTRVRLTPAGRQLLAGAVEVEQVWRRTLTRIGAPAARTGDPVRMGFLRAGHANPLWPRLCALTPGRRWEPRHYAVLSSGLRDLRAGTLDLFLWSVCHAPDTPADVDLTGVESADIAVEDVRVSLSEQHPLAGLARVPFAELARYDWVAPTAAQEREQTAALCRAVGGFTPRFVSEVDAYGEVMTLIRDTRAVDLGPPSAPPYPGVVHRPVTPAPRSRYALSWRPGPDPAPLVPDVLAVLRHRYAEKTRAWNPAHWRHIVAHPHRYPGIADALGDAAPPAA